MFGGLRQNSLFYILDRGGENPSLRIGQVVTVSNPVPKYGNVTAGQLYTQPEQVIDITVRADDETLEFKQLPTAQDIANSGTLVLSDTREAMLQEVEGMKRTSQSVLDSVEHHKGVLSSCEAMIATLNPQIAKEREQEQRIGAMEAKMGGIETALSDIQTMLATALNKPAVRQK